MERTLNLPECLCGGLKKTFTESIVMVFFFEVTMTDMQARYFVNKPVLSMDKGQICLSRL